MPRMWTENKLYDDTEIFSNATRKHAQILSATPTLGWICVWIVLLRVVWKYIYFRFQSICLYVWMYITVRFENCWELILPTLFACHFCEMKNDKVFCSLVSFKSYLFLLRSAFDSFYFSQYTQYTYSQYTDLRFGTSSLWTHRIGHIFDASRKVCS